MANIHPVATEHLPAFIAAPGSTDTLMVFSAVFLVVAVLGAGVFFLWLHSLPERLVHNRLQYDLVAILALLSLFTHVHAFWIAALLLAFITVPDLSNFNILSPLRSIASSLKAIADRNSRQEDAIPPLARTAIAAPSSTVELAAKEC